MVLQSVVLPGKVFTNVSLQIKDECAMVIGSTPWKMCHLSRFYTETTNVKRSTTFEDMIVFFNEPVQHTVRGVRYFYLNLSVKLDACALSTGHFFFWSPGPGDLRRRPPHTKTNASLHGDPLSRRMPAKIPMRI